MTTLVLLQNAWSELYAGKSWPRESWLRALEYSHSGRRLKWMLGEGCYSNLDIHFDNTTPQVGSGPAVVLPPDLEHVRDLLEYAHPGLVIACGLQAVAAIQQTNYAGWLFHVPHPAARILPKELYAAAGEKRRKIRQTQKPRRLRFAPLRQGDSSGYEIRPILDTCPAADITL